jgi:hypothetical protein
MPLSQGREVLPVFLMIAQKCIKNVKAEKFKKEPEQFTGSPEIFPIISADRQRCEAAVSAGFLPAFPMSRVFPLSCPLTGSAVQQI